MTKKDYELIAEMLGTAIACPDPFTQKVSVDQALSIIWVFESRLAKENPKFDPNKFRGAVWGAERLELAKQGN